MSQDGGHIAAADSACTVRVWDGRTGVRLHDLVHDVAPQVGGPVETDRFWFSEEQKRVSAIQDPGYTLRRWEVASGRLLQVRKLLGTFHNRRYRTTYSLPGWTGNAREDAEDLRRILPGPDVGDIPPTVVGHTRIHVWGPTGQLLRCLRRTFDGDPGQGRPPPLSCQGATLDPRQAETPEGRRMQDAGAVVEP